MTIQKKNRVADLAVAHKLKIEFTDLQNQLAALNDTRLVSLLQMLQGTYASTAKLLFWLWKYPRVETLPAGALASNTAVEHTEQNKQSHHCHKTCQTFIISVAMVNK